jgi:hypothetical protein
MKREAQEQHILNAAIEAVHRTTGIRLKAKPQIKKDGRLIDAEITIKGKKKPRFAAEIKKWAQQANFGAMVNQVKRLPGKGMLVADYVDPKMADRLREMKIPFIDTVGNAYINEKPLYILVKTTRAQRNDGIYAPGMMQTRTQGRAFNPTGLKVLYQFLIDEKLLNAPYRDIAAKADVALGTIGWVINDLKKGGYLIEIAPKNRRLKRKQRLLDKWVDAYLERLRPKLVVGTFRAENPRWWKKVENKITTYGAKWGGEIAAHEMTGYLTPQEVTIYLETGDGAALFNEHRFRKDPDGDIHVYRAFWKKEEAIDKQHENFINPLIAYADLTGTGDVRNLEAAEQLLGEELAELIRED